MINIQKGEIIFFVAYNIVLLRGKIHVFTFSLKYSFVCFLVVSSTCMCIDPENKF